MNPGRIGAIVEKELRELRSNPSAVLPVAILVTLCLTVPFLILVVMPRMTGESLAADRTLREIVERSARTSPRLAALSTEAAVEAFMYQQFLLLFLVAPIVGAVSLAAYSVVERNKAGHSNHCSRHRSRPPNSCWQKWSRRFFQRW